MHARLGGQRSLAHSVVWCDDTPFDITTLSRDPEGDQADGLSAAQEHLATFHVDGQTLELQLERVPLKPGFQVWLVSADSVAMIPRDGVVSSEPLSKSCGLPPLHRCWPRSRIHVIDTKPDSRRLKIVKVIEPETVLPVKNR
jgi:hypothetical protein